jgi:hypothetical protein
MDFGISTSWTENQAIQTLSGLKTSPVKLTHFKHWDPPTTNHPPDFKPESSIQASFSI